MLNARRLRGWRGAGTLKGTLKRIQSVGEPSLRSFVANLSASGYHVYLLHSRGLVRISGRWWHPFYELALLPAPPPPAQPIDCWHDLFAVRDGPAHAALTRVFNERPFPCHVLEGAACPVGAPLAPPLATEMGEECARCELRT